MAVQSFSQPHLYHKNYASQRCGQNCLTSKRGSSGEEPGYEATSWYMAIYLLWSCGATCSTVTVNKQEFSFES